MTKTRASGNPQGANAERGPRILAKSIYKELRGQGYTSGQIVAVTTELIGLVTADLPLHDQANPKSEPQVRGQHRA